VRHGFWQRGQAAARIVVDAIRGEQAVQGFSRLPEMRGVMTTWTIETVRRQLELLRGECRELERRAYSGAELDEFKWRALKLWVEIERLEKA
jgi:hypothetical protein